MKKVDILNFDTLIPEFKKWKLDSNFKGICGEEDIRNDIAHIERISLLSESTKSQTKPDRYSINP